MIFDGSHSTLYDGRHDPLLWAGLDRRLSTLVPYHVWYTWTYESYIVHRTYIAEFRPKSSSYHSLITILNLMKSLIMANQPRIIRIHVIQLHPPFNAIPRHNDPQRRFDALCVRSIHIEHVGVDRHTARFPRKENEGMQLHARPARHLCRTMSSIYIRRQIMQIAFGW